MKKPRILCVILALFMTLTAISGPAILPLAAAEAVDYVRDGLVSWYKGDRNTPDGHNTSSSVWHDLVSGHDLPVNTNASNYFTEEGLRVQGTKHYFPEEVLELVNDSYFTIEIEFGDFEPIGQDYNVFMNSTTDYFSLFRRVSEDVIEWKFGGGNTRPKIQNSLRYLGDHLLTFTCEYGGSIIMYVDGVEMARADCDLYMGADDLFIGQTSESRSYDALYKNIRFYSRPLTADEVEQNAYSMGYDPEEIFNAITHVTVAQPVTNIVGDVAMIRPVNSQAELEAMLSGETLPASAIYEINANLEVLDTEGRPFSTVAEVMEKTEFKVLSCFSIKDKSTATALTDYLHEIYFFDVQLMSADKEILKYAREKLPNCYGILDLRTEYADTADLSSEQLLDIRRAVKTYNASVAILPMGLCRNEDVQYLYERQVNVWSWGSASPDKTEMYFALLSGAMGIVTDATAEHLDIACNKLAQNTLTRVPTNVGHRGIPTIAPECTLEGSILAYEQGANVIEMDVYLTLDGHVVAMHDSTTGRTCDKDLHVESSTLAQLKKLYVNKGYETDPTYSKCRIPTLDEYLEWFKGKECLFFIEIKSGDPDIVPAIKNAIDKYNAYDQCSVITFNTNIMAAMRKDYPEMSVGALSSSHLMSGSSEAEINHVQFFIGPYNGTYNPYYGNCDAADLRACTMRGISVYPWTLPGDTTVISNFFLWGYGGLTNNSANLLGDTVRKIEFADDLTLELDSTTTIDYTVTYYNGTTAKQPSASVILLDGDATVRSNTITPLAEGDVTFMTAATFDLMGETTYVMYTQPVTVTIRSPESETVFETDTDTVTDSETASDTTALAESARETEPSTTRPDEGTADTSGDKPPAGGCKSAISGMALGIISLAAIITAAKKREDL